MRDLLFKDGRQKKVFVVKRPRKGVKEASLEYVTLWTENGYSRVLVKLHTGRTHQIRAQFASRGMPLSGDGKYGSRDNAKRLGLSLRKLTFRRMSDGETVSVCAPGPNAVCPSDTFD